MNGVKIGAGELLFLALVLIIVFSASRMSAIGNALGKFVHSFKKASKGEGFVDGKHTVTRLGNGQVVSDAEIVDEKKT